METIILTVVMLLVLYFIAIRPENKRKKAEDKMRSELAVGDTVTTIGGLTGTICAVKESTIVIETGADRVRVEFVKSAIASKNAATDEAAQ